MNDALGARRIHLRFEINGQLWVSLGLRADITLHDLTVEGALIEGPSGAAWSGLCTMTVQLRDDGLSVTGLVRHVSPSPTDPRRQLVGLEFVQVSPAARTALQLLVGQSTE